MRPRIDLVKVTVLALISALGVGRSRADEQAAPPGGLVLAQTYAPGKTPVVPIHGLGSRPKSWRRAEVMRIFTHRSAASSTWIRGRRSAWPSGRRTRQTEGSKRWQHGPPPPA
jgi:hypothetical protein